MRATALCEARPVAARVEGVQAASEEKFCRLTWCLWGVGGGAPICTKLRRVWALKPQLESSRMVAALLGTTGTHGGANSGQGARQSDRVAEGRGQMKGVLANDLSGLNLDFVHFM